mmetsp:Transcript_18376/g.44215  ORF Transcript_18376/g.44215 Transcript_18376/m.44215 type:complete len:158 (-) Transcript_18376:48-521(-)
MPKKGQKKQSTSASGKKESGKDRGDGAAERNAGPPERTAAFLATAPPDSVRVSLRVKPGAKRTQVVIALADAGEEAATKVLASLDQLELQIAAPPRDGEANAEVVDFVAELTGTKKGACSLVAGHASRDKVVEVRGVSAARALESIVQYVLGCSGLG